MTTPLSCFKDRLLDLKLLPLMYISKQQDILFAIQSLKFPTNHNHFNINNVISFNSSTTRSGASYKLLIPQHLNNTAQHSYFHHLPSLWNAMPIMDMNLSYVTLKYKLKIFLWNHFIYLFYLLMLYGKGQRSASNLCLQPNTQNVQLY